MRRHLVALSLLTTLGVAGAADIPEVIETGLLPTWWIDTAPPVPQSIAERMAYYKTPAVSVAVILDGELAWAKAWGVADTATGRAANADTLFQAASISKPVAALAALDLMEAGELDLDADVNTLLERWELPENDFTVDEKVTLRRIVNHTAGLTVWGFPGYDPNGEWPTAPELLDGKGNTDPVRVYREPGFDWQYSGGGYTVMQVALEDVSGKDFTTLMAERVLKPLEMTHSTYAQPLPAALRSNVALGYRNSGDVVSGGAHIYPEQAAAGLWTTPSDLAQYLIAVREMARGQAGLLEPETATMMLTPGKNNHGLGPAISSADDGSRFGHGGSNEGFKCNMFASLDGGYGAIVMTNADPGFALGQEIFATLAEHYGWPGFEPDVKTVLPKTPAELETYAGTYQLNGFGKIFVAVDDDALLISADFDEDRDRFLPESEHGFFDAQDRTSLAFELDEDGEAAVLIYSGRFRANRIED